MTGQQLKNSILQMAVQGKLVPQDPNDEPASVLLEKIRKEKERLIKEGKIKKEKNPSYIFRGADNLPYEKVGNNEPVCIADEVPFDIPDSWEWVRLSTVNNMYTGNSINETEKKTKYTGLPDGYYYIGTKDVRFDHTIDYDNGVRIPYGMEKFKVAQQNSILLCIEGGSAGRKISFTNQDVCFGNKLCCFTSYGVDYLFLYYYLQSPLFQEIFKKNTTGIIGGVSVNTLKQLFFPVPPLGEQKRIVEKILILEPFLGSYATTKKAITKLDNDFPKQLKKSVLQEAVQGKLVPQDPNDEPASVLLERIRAEKQRLVREGKIKKDKHESIIFRRDNSYYEKLDEIERCIDDELPFEIPDNWQWTRLGNLLSVISDGTHKTPNYLDKGIPFLSVQNISHGYFDFTKLKYISDEEHKKLIERVEPKADDILICRIGTLGKAIKNTLDFEFSIFVSVGLLRPVISDIADYIILCINSPFGDKWIQENKVGGGTHTFKINLVDIPKMFIPLPPLEEQKRIIKQANLLLSSLKTL